jgi:hypothetical protein
MVGKGLAGLPKTDMPCGNDFVTTVPMPILQ